MSAVEIRDLSKIYKGKLGKSVIALKELNLIIDRGEVFGFLGPNGAGKSTTIKAVMGLIGMTGGSASICGLPVQNADSRRNVGYLPENPSFYDFLTGREYLAFVGRAFAMNAKLVSERSAEMLQRLELDHAAGRPIRSYSKGMVQRLGLAQALLHDPDVYILDEPMSGLDPLGRSLVKAIIKELKQKGKTVFFSTHITADVEAVCDRVGVIVEGQLRIVDRVENILRGGIKGYCLHMTTLEIPPQFSAEVTILSVNGAVMEVSVPKELFNPFMEYVIRSGGAVELIETDRTDLETFFLHIVAKGKR